MNTQNYSTWLVPLDIAQHLKEIGFDEPCNHYVRISNDDIKLKINHSSIGLVMLIRNSEYLNDDIASFVTIPTWTDVFAWFRARGLHHTIRYILAHKLYFYAINETYYLKNKGSGIYDTYEEAQKECVKALIKTYKTMKK